VKLFLKKELQFVVCEYAIAIKIYTFKPEEMASMHYYEKLNLWTAVNGSTN